jgi:tRNA U34 5-methylaminomethyl-2-thiouridine-forming methyltransferase MnmC
LDRKIFTTSDGSHSVQIPEMNVTYHSVHGAIQESQHVFIEAGLHFITQSGISRLRIFEMGLGTGLNAFLTAIEGEKQKLIIDYTVVEQFPLGAEEVKALNYPGILKHEEWFHHIHNSEWNDPVNINQYFTLNKIQTNFFNFSSAQLFNLVYYDAFAPNAQPELWTKEVFEKLFSLLEPNGVLVTYCSKGAVRRAMMSAGFSVEKLPGPPGKREMLRAVKIST